MGLGYESVRPLLAARAQGASFERVVTLGHLQLNLFPQQIRELAGEFDLPMDTPRPGWAGSRYGDYSDRFFAECMGTGDLTVLDASAYQGASLVHDLNKPVPADWRQQYDAVIDGGTLEHVFDVAEALANMMRLARVGGRVFIVTAANNLCGHGFYQFSPELMFRAFAQSHGFDAARVELIEAPYPAVHAPTRASYSVRDPAELGERVRLVSRRPVRIAVEAVKVHHLDEPFAEAPQQSDYSQRWAKGQADGGGGKAVSRFHGLVERLPPRLSVRLRGARAMRRFSFRNQRAYTRGG